MNVVPPAERSALWSVAFCCSRYTHRQGSERPRNLIELYDYYFPRRGEYLDSSYRDWFDQMLVSGDGHDRHDLRGAMRGDPHAFHTFAHHSDRDAAGEFGLTWRYECLFLLLYLGDQDSHGCLL